MSAPEIYYPLAGGGGGGVSGSGTANTIPRWDAGSPSTTLTDSLLSQSGAIITNSGTFLADNGSQAAPAYAFTSSPGTGMFCASTDPFLRFAVTGTYRVVVTAAGDVGVNTNTPREMLHVSGGSVKVGANANDSFLSFGDESTTVRNVGVYRGAGATALSLGGYGGITFHASAAALGSQAEQMRITSTGNVGIGTASPSTRLHVSDNSSTPMIVQSSGSTDSFLRFINTSNNLGYIGYIGTNLYLAPNNGTGNVGIGTASPTAALDTPASTTTRATLRIRSGVAPTAPNTGDVWFDGTSLFMRNGAGTQTVSFGGGGGATAWVNFDGTVAGTWAGGASTVTRVAGSTTATVTTTNDHGLITGNGVYALSGVAVGYYTVTVTGLKTFTITTVATTALSAVAITFAVNNIRASGGVSSITDVAVGQYVVNFTSAMPDINYSAIGTKQNVSTNTDVSLYDCFGAVASVPARTVNASGWLCLEGAAFFDSANVNIAYFR